MWIDIVLLIILLFSFLRGYKKGIIHTLFSSLALIIAILATLKLSPNAIDFISNKFNAPDILAFVLGVVFVFLFFYVGIEFIGKFLEKMLKKIHLNIFNKIAGGILSGVIALLIYAFIIDFLSEYQLISEISKEESFSFSILEAIPAEARKAFASLSPYFAEFWEKANETFRQLNKGK